MKKFQFFLLILILLIIHSSRLLGQCSNCEQLYINDPRQWWSHTQAAIDDVSFVIRPAGKFYEVDLYMTYQATPFGFVSAYDTFEVVHYFRLPKYASFTDSWLWVEDTIMRADILERSTAFNIYEGIVNRRKDPSILYKNYEDAYEFRIFPLPGKKSRKVKLTMLVASDENDAIELPLSMFALSYPRPEVKVSVYKKDTPLTPLISNGVNFVTKVDGVEGEYATASIPAIKYSGNGGTINSFTFRLDQPKENIVLKTAKASENSSFGYYQICLDPAQLLGIDTLEQKKVVFVVDHHTSNTYYNKQDVLNALKGHIKKIIKPKDQFRILYNNLNVKEVSTDWLSLNSVDLDQLIASISLGNNSVLTSLLYKGYEYLKNEDEGILMLMSSDASVVQPSDAQSLKDDLQANVGILRPTYALDYGNFGRHNKGIYYIDTYYYGNELFYKVLSSNTKGAYFGISIYNGSYLLTDALRVLQNGLSEARFDFVDYLLRPKEGICYDGYDVTNGLRVTKTGRFVGKTPFNLEVVALYKDSLITANYILDAENDVQLTPIYKQCHAMSKITHLENGLVNSADKKDIVEISLDNRVLSLYTAFLALEPGVKPCFDCEDDDGVLIGVEEEEADGIALEATPNPFRNVLTIQLNGVEDAGDVEKTELIDLTGRVATLDLDWKRGDDGLTAELDGSDLQSGMYILRITVKGKVYILKVVKA